MPGFVRRYLDRAWTRREGRAAWLDTCAEDRTASGGGPGVEVWCKVSVLPGDAFFEPDLAQLCQDDWDLEEERDEGDEGDEDAEDSTVNDSIRDQRDVGY